MALERSPRKQARVCSFRGETNTQKKHGPSRGPSALKMMKISVDLGRPWKGGLSLDMEDCVLLSYGLKDTSGKTGEGNEQCGGLIRSKEEIKKEKQQ